MIHATGFGPTDKLVAAFNSDFHDRGIRLSPADVAVRRRGKITRRGWTVWYLFGEDASGAYLDYYASHRMTNDLHIRIRQDGSSETLPAIEDFRATSTNPAEDARLEAEYLIQNQRVARLLRAKGFGCGQP